MFENFFSYIKVNFKKTQDQREAMAKAQEQDCKTLYFSSTINLAF